MNARRLGNGFLAPGCTPRRRPASLFHAGVPALQPGNQASAVNAATIALMEAIWAPTLLVTRDLNVCLANKYARTWFAGQGLLADPTGRPFDQAFSCMPKQVMEQLREVIDTAQARVSEHQVFLGGSSLILMVEASPVILRGSLAGLLIVLRNVTGRRKRETTLRRLEDVFEHQPGAASMFGIDGDLDLAKHAFLDLLDHNNRKITEKLRLGTL